MDGLHVGEDTLPVGLSHRNHVVHVQQWVDARLLTETYTKISDIKERILHFFASFLFSK